MINIRINEYGYTVTGHADYAEHGKDIVCSAVSALALTGIEALNDVIECARSASPGNLYVEFDGDAFIQNGGADVVFEAKTILDTIKTGFALIANKYPQHVNLEETA